MQPSGGAPLAGVDHPAQPGPGLLGGGPVRVGVRLAGELVDLVADRHAEEVGPFGEGGGEGAQIGGLAVDHVRVGEHVPAVPGADPGRFEVEAGQMALEAVHGDVEPALPGRVHQRHQLLDGARADQRAVGLEQRPEREHPDVVEAERGDRVEVGADGVEVEVEPVVEPAGGGRVVDAEARGGGPRSGGHGR